MKEDKTEKIITVVCIVIAFVLLLGMGFSIILFGPLLR